MYTPADAGLASVNPGVRTWGPERPDLGTVMYLFLGEALARTDVSVTIRLGVLNRFGSTGRSPSSRPSLESSVARTNVNVARHSNGACPNNWFLTGLRG